MTTPVPSTYTSPMCTDSKLRYVCHRMVHTSFYSSKKLPVTSCDHPVSQMARVLYVNVHFETETTKLLVLCSGVIRLWLSVSEGLRLSSLCTQRSCVPLLSRDLRC